MQKVPADRRHNHRRHKGRPNDDADVRVGESLLLADDGEEGRHQGEADGAEEDMFRQRRRDSVPQHRPLGSPPLIIGFLYDAK